MDATVWFCHIARAMNTLLDGGQSLGMDETKDRIRDETLFRWIDESFPDPNLGLSGLFAVDQAEVLESFQDMASARTERSYGISRNGIALVLAYSIEGIQRLHPIAPDTNPDE